MRARCKKPNGLRDFIWKEIHSQVKDVTLFIMPEFTPDYCFASNVDPKKLTYRAVSDGNMAKYLDVASLMNGVFKGKISVILFKDDYPRPKPDPAQDDEPSTSQIKDEYLTDSSLLDEIQPDSASPDIKRKRADTTTIETESFDKKIKREDSPGLFVDPTEVHTQWTNNDEYPFGSPNLSEDSLPTIEELIKKEPAPTESVKAPSKEVSKFHIKIEDMPVKLEEERTLFKTPDPPADLLEVSVPISA